MAFAFPVASALTVALELERRGVRHFACLGVIEVYSAADAQLVQRLIADPFGRASSLDAPRVEPQADTGDDP